MSWLIDRLHARNVTKHRVRMASFIPTQLHYEVPLIVTMINNEVRMGSFDVTGSATGQEGGAPNATVVGGLMKVLDEHPGGLAAVLDSFRNNGMAGQVHSWARGQQKRATPEQMQQGLGDTGLIDRVAAQAGVSSEAAKANLAALLPIVILHCTAGGQYAPPQSGFGVMTTQILSKLL
jgi:uncharacterized protein YidB (DUF937 family)